MLYEKEREGGARHTIGIIFFLVFFCFGLVCAHDVGAKKLLPVASTSPPLFVLLLRFIARYLHGI